MRGVYPCGCRVKGIGRASSQRRVQGWHGAAKVLLLGRPAIHVSAAWPGRVGKVEDGNGGHNNNKQQHWYPQTPGPYNSR